MQDARLKRLKIIGVIGIIYSLFLILDNIIGKTSKIELFIACSLFICSIIFIITSMKLKRIQPKDNKKSRKS